MIFLYLIIAVVIVAFAILMLRVRIRVQLDQDRRILFLGLGRSGSEIDFVDGLARIKLAGFTIRELPLEEDETTAGKTKPEKRTGSLSSRMTKRAWRKSRREFDRLREGIEMASGGKLGDLLSIARKVIGALFQFMIDLVRDSRLEELEAEVTGGFDSPDLTGQAYGYYCAFAGALPSTAGRVAYIPDWTGASLTGSARMSIAIPLYKLVYRTARLLMRLPISTIVHMVRQKNKGGSDV